MGKSSSQRGKEFRARKKLLPKIKVVFSDPDFIDWDKLEYLWDNSPKEYSIFF